MGEHADPERPRLDACPSLTVEVREATAEDRVWLAEFLSSTWGLPLVSVSGAYHPDDLSGLVAWASGERVGALTYRVEGAGMEVITLDSMIERRGIASALLGEVRRRARAEGRRLWLVTTDENRVAIAFYVRRSMALVAVHRDFVDVVRALKPEMPSTYRHGLEFEDHIGEQSLRHG